LFFFAYFLFCPPFVSKLITKRKCIPGAGISGTFSAQCDSVRENLVMKLRDAG
jgi:hypothetical protein